MATIKILVTGYTTADTKKSGDERTSPTISLVRDRDLVILVDPGVLENQQILVDSLKTEGLTVSDVNVVFITHSHLDHYRNIGMFPQAKTLEYWGLWDQNRVVDWPQKLSPDIEVIKTPGHSSDSLSLLVQTNQGLVAICGDVFWKKDYPEKDEYANDPEELVKSRQKILARADFIIPGHGEMFKAK